MKRDIIFKYDDKNVFVKDLIEIEKFYNTQSAQILQ